MNILRSINNDRERINRSDINSDAERNNDNLKVYYYNIYIDQFASIYLTTTSESYWNEYHCVDDGSEDVGLLDEIMENFEYLFDNAGVSTYIYIREPGSTLCIPSLNELLYPYHVVLVSNDEFNQFIMQS